MTMQLIDTFRLATFTQSYFSPAEAQDLLFNLYGEVNQPDAKALLETWLSLTIQRGRFSSSELLIMLDELESLLVVRT